MRLICLLLVAAALPGLADLEPREAENQVQIFENGKFLTSCVFRRVPVVFPLPSSSGANLARHWPLEEAAAGEATDHPHQRSLWLSHGDVNGYDFWAWTRKGDPHIRHTRTHDLQSGKDSASFRLDLDWIADGRRLLGETRTYTFRRHDADTLLIDLVTQLKATEGPVQFNETKEAFFGLRVDRTLRQEGPLAKGGILDSEGRRNADCWGKPATWCAFHGPDEKGRPAVLAMMGHPQNFGFPTHWHARGYGLLAANPFGGRDFDPKLPRHSGDYPLEAGQTLTLRYRVVLQHAEMDAKTLDRLAEDFGKS